MSLLQPTINQYQISVDLLQNYFSQVKSQVDWVVYGSFINHKLRPGLSDIDVFVLAKNESFIFPIEISKTIGQLKYQIESTGVPLQANLVTTGMLKNAFIHPDMNYLLEVQKGINCMYASPGFNISYTNQRDPRQDDASMSRYFLRKISDIGTYIPEIDEIMQKTPENINLNDQKKIWELWDNFKKVLTFLTNSIRIAKQESLFGESDRTIIETCKQEFDITNDAQRYISIMDNIKNIEDWYNYLKNGGIQEIEKVYTDIFTPFINAIGNKLCEPLGYNK